MERKSKIMKTRFFALAVAVLAIAACVLLYVFRDKAKELLPASVVNVLSKVLNKARDLVNSIK